MVSACALELDVHSFNKCLLDAYFMLGGWPGTGDKMTRKTDKGPQGEALCPSGSPLCSILRSLLGVTGMYTIGKSLLGMNFPLWQEMEQGLSRWGTVAYQP